MTAVRQSVWKRHGLQDEEVGTQILLGPEFETSDQVRPLTVSEAKIIIDTNFGKRTAEQQAGKNECVRKTDAYLDTFARFRGATSVLSVESILRRPENGLHPFESAQIGTLCVEEAEEAKCLVPSLASKIGDDMLQALLDELTNLRKFQ